MELYFYNDDDSTGRYSFKVCPSAPEEDRRRLLEKKMTNKLTTSPKGKVSAMECQEGMYVSSSSSANNKKQAPNNKNNKSSKQSANKKKKTVVSKAINFACGAHTSYDITLTKYSDDDKDSTTIISTQTAKALCLYVRRELRTLTDSDLQAFIEASYILQSTSESEGVAKYGEDYHNMSYLVRFHHYNAAQRDQDHIHQGNGFLMQHIKITNMFDDMVMYVDPSQSMPYWEFTIDNAEGYMPWQSPLYTADTYGGVNTAATLNKGFQYSTDKIANGRIPDGRWQDLQVEYNTYYPDLNAGYGYLRAPWNMNPSPYISRFGFDFNGSITFPSCDSHYEGLQYTDMMDFFYGTSLDAHAKTHILGAGFYGCDIFNTLVDEGYIINSLGATAICSQWSFYVKEFWRSGYIEAKTGCVVNTENLEQSECGFTCNNQYIDKIIKFVYPQIANFVDINKAGINERLKEFICNEALGSKGSFTGDHLESASPADPSFWVIHPTMERLLQAKLMTGGFGTEKWSTDTENDYVCDTGSKCYDFVTRSMVYSEECCYGHKEHDQMYDAIAGTRTAKTGSTNAEILAATDPRSKFYSMPYIYDKFTWDHCQEDFVGLIDELAMNIKTKKSWTPPAQQKRVQAKKEVARKATLEK